MATITWAGRLASLGASLSEVAAIQAAYDASTSNVRRAVNELVEGIDSAGLLTMLSTWRAGLGPFSAGLPGGGLPFGTHVAVTSGVLGDDAFALGAGTGAKISPSGVTKAAVIETGLAAPDIGAIALAQVGAPDGVPSLDDSSNVPVQFLGNAVSNAGDTSDAVRLQTDRFYREVALVLSYDGTQFVAETDAFSRPANVDQVTSDSTKITVLHQQLGASHVAGSPSVVVGQNMASVGIAASGNVSSDLTSTDIFLKQTRVFDDAVSYNGSSWVLERGVLSPFTVTFSSGLLHVTHATIGSVHPSEIRLTGLGALRPVLVPASVTATTFDVAFYDATNTQVSSASTSMAVAISREVRDLPVNPTALSVPTIVQKADSWANVVDGTAPVLWARLGEASGTTFTDIIGGNDGASQATVTLGAAGAISGDSNTAVTLDGAQGKIAFASPALLGSYSISLWFRCTGPGSVGQTTYGTLFGNNTTHRVLYNRTNGSILAQMAGTSAQTPTSIAALSVWNHVVYTWDGTTQRITVNGIQQFEGVTANAAFNVPFWLGSYLATSTNYSFKGDMDELLIWDRKLSLNEIQQLYVTGANSVFTTDRALDSKIGYRCLFETVAPPPDPIINLPAPDVTALPAGDAGGGATSYVSLAPYRAAGNLNFGPSSPWAHRALPATQAARDAIALNGLPSLPLATSDNWRLHCCSMFGIDPTTGGVVAATQGGSTPLFMRVAGEHIYVVDGTEPLRSISDLDVTISGWATTFDAAVTTLGGLPVPADALPHSTEDRYAFVYQPPNTWVTLYAFQPGPGNQASVTLSLTGSPSNGGFFFEFDYIDPVNQNVQTFACQAPVAFNATGAQLQAAIFNAKTASGAVLGSARAGVTPVLCTGGPLNVAPIVLSWPIAAAMYPVAIRITNTFMNSGAVQVTYGQNAQPWSGGRLCAITSPSLANNHVPTSGVGVPVNSGGTAAATGIDWMPLIIDWDEYNTAYNIGIASGWDAPGTDLGHVIAMSIGNAGTGSVFPALPGRYDGTITNTDGSKVREGAFMTFPIAADSSKCAPELMPLFNTMRRYGCVPIDKTGGLGGAEIIFRNWQWPGQTRPFPGPPNFKINSSNVLNYMRQLPWHQLQFIDPAQVLAGW
jgi:hypothetical protein